MMLYRQMALEVEINIEARVKAVADHAVQSEIVNIVGSLTIEAIAPHMGKNVASAGRRIILRLCVSLVLLSTKETVANTDPKEKDLKRNFMKSMRMKGKS